MSIENTPSQYGSISKLFHWVLALLLIAMVAFGIYLENAEFLPDQIQQKIKLIGLHKSTGILILALVVLRLAWRLKNTTPTAPVTMPQWQKLAANVVHGVLYVAMFAMPITGWMYSSIAGFPVNVYGLFTLPSLLPKNEELTDLFHSIHGFFGDVLIVAFVLHVGAALYHHFYVKDTVLKRMLPFSRVD